MACGKDIPEQQQHLATTSTTDQVAWFVDWMPCIGIDSPWGWTNCLTSTELVEQGW